MFRLLLLISCLGFVIGYGGESVAKSKAAEPKVWFGDAEGDNDLDRLASGGYTKITGALIVPKGQKKPIDLPQLKTIGGGLAMAVNDNLTSISMPRLQSIGGGFSITDNRNRKLTTIDMPQLQTVEGWLDISETPILTDCDLGSYTVEYCP